MTSSFLSHTPLLLTAHTYPLSQCSETKCKGLWFASRAASRAVRKSAHWIAHVKHFLFGPYDYLVWNSALHISMNSGIIINHVYDYQSWSTQRGGQRSGVVKRLFQMGLMRTAFSIWGWMRTAFSYELLNWDGFFFERVEREKSLLRMSWNEKRLLSMKKTICPRFQGNSARSQYDRAQMQELPKRVSI